MDINYFNRYTNQMEVEKVYGDTAINFLYGNPLGKLISGAITSSIVSCMYGEIQNMNFTKNKVPKFVKDYQINMDDFLPTEGRSKDDPYGSFNEFFIRRFKEGKRPFLDEADSMSSFAEARYFGYESINNQVKIPVKGKFLNSTELLQNSKWESVFEDGPLLLARLCPVDYHRFHYPLDGEVIDYYKIGGGYHSVNPLALRKKNDIFSTNIREVTVMQTKEFGKIAYVEVGATMVGRIVQSSDLTTFKRGDEKGYFLFGGSTVIVIGEKGKWSPTSDILNNTKNGIETYIHLADKVAQTGK
ncbi:phosphatidylserine decarboxylase [Halobacteriovorax sp. RT-2-2]|uniref:phosphatidylserine decarboxylase n=2 Tax=unclassified Halobacteriovorax TaxID=2639665 RepID=UPI0039A75801